MKMYHLKKVSQDITWVGGNDRRLALFENVFPISRGVSYNSYFIDDDKTVLIDTVDRSVSAFFFENLKFLLQNRPLNYVIVNHVEPDHSAALAELVLRYPEVKIIATDKSIRMLKQYFSFEIDSRAVVVTQGDSICTGKHTFDFFTAPMVHWPEVMVTYDAAEQALFSADAFGTFGALDGNLFADELNFKTSWLLDARRYYTNIVGKYGKQVQLLLKKVANLNISRICPLHGPTWRKDIPWFLDLYQKWSSYIPEEKAVLIAYASAYGNTAHASEILASFISDMGVKNIAIYDVSATDRSVILSEAFRCSHLIFAAPTYNAGIFCNMETLLLDIKAHNLQNRTVALIENGSWAPMANSLMHKIISSMENMTILDEKLSIKSSIKEEQLDELKLIANSVVASVEKF
jgi:flavorubredoxin